MAKRMLIDASQPEETRVVVLSGDTLEGFDFETAAKKSLKGNIYLAKVVRVEPSLQAAFVDFGGNRHGFLAFNEIHPDYYRIPIADRKALLAEEARIASDTEGDDNNGKNDKAGENVATLHTVVDKNISETTQTDTGGTEGDRAENGDAVEQDEKSAEFVGLETIGGDIDEDIAPKRGLATRRYKIQEVIKRSQILLVQVTKEERGSKGAALTTRISLAGRYCVLMPNTARGGGISRKITDPADRRKLKTILDGLSIPEGVAVIVRTAGHERARAEIKRDYEYLMCLWNEIRDSTMKSSAPSLVYEEANIIKRAIRDLYSRDMEEVLVDSEDGYRLAKESMRMLTPSHAKRVKRYRDGDTPLFSHFRVEDQINAIHNHTVRLKAGGYIVIDQTEALVSIDVNSGRSTRERNIEETALRTNLEAADEIARQLRLRDMAGLIVIDFIDMDEQGNCSKVEKCIKEALKTDRARIQIGRISAFGLLEMSRQRLRPSLHEISTRTCPHCDGRGVIRSVESTALHVLRALEEESVRSRGPELSVYVPPKVDLYILNQKRDILSAIESRHGFRVTVHHDGTLIPPDFRIESGKNAKAADTLLDKKREKKERPSSIRRAKPVKEAPAEKTQDASPVTKKSGKGEEEEDKPPRKRRRRGKRGGRRHSRRSASKKTQTEITDVDSESKAAFASAGNVAPEEDSKAATKPRKCTTRRTRKPAKNAAGKRAAAASNKAVKTKAAEKSKEPKAEKEEIREDPSPPSAPPTDKKPKRGGWWNAVAE
ncbi:MAG: ribonuclease E/G [Alphaproteobacteria bacterium]|nr:ribonuclease E/G [Alphaproteobacteria bacterium]